MNKAASITTIALTLAGLLAATAPLRAAEEEAAPKVEKRVVIREGDGEPQVFAWRGKEGGLLMAGGRGYLGVQLVDLTPELRQHFGSDEKSGVMVGQVESESPAAKAGLQVGDVITTIDGEPVAWSGELGRLVRQKKQGESVRIEGVRNGRGMSLEVPVAERDPERLLLRKIDAHGVEGLELEGLEPAIERALRVASDPEIEKRLREAMERRQERTRELEERLRGLEQRLRELEKQLDKGGSR